MLHRVRLVIFVLLGFLFQSFEGASTLSSSEEAIWLQSYETLAKTSLQPVQLAFAQLRFRSKPKEFLKWLKSFQKILKEEYDLGLRLAKAFAADEDEKEGRMDRFVQAKRHFEHQLSDSIFERWHQKFFDLNQPFSSLDLVDFSKSLYGLLELRRVIQFHLTNFPINVDKKAVAMPMNAKMIALRQDFRRWSNRMASREIEWFYLGFEEVLQGGIDAFTVMKMSTTPEHIQDIMDVIYSLLESEKTYYSTLQNSPMAFPLDGMLEIQNDHESFMYKIMTDLILPYEDQLYAWILNMDTLPDWAQNESTMFRVFKGIQTYQTWLALTDEFYQHEQERLQFMWLDTLHHYVVVLVQHLEQHLLPHLSLDQRVQHVTKVLHNFQARFGTLRTEFMTFENDLHRLISSQTKPVLQVVHPLQKIVDALTSQVFRHHFE